MNARSDQQPKWLTAIALVIVLAISLGIVAFVLNVFQAITRMKESTRTPIITAITAIIVTIISVVLTRYFERRADQERAQQEKRIPVYEDFVKEFLSLIGATKPPSQRKSEMSPEEIYTVLGKFTERLIVWGSDEVIRHWAAYRHAMASTTEDRRGLQSLTLMNDFLLALRKDLGLSNRKLEEFDLLRLWINDLDPEGLKQEPSTAG